MQKEHLKDITMINKKDDANIEKEQGDVEPESAEDETIEDLQTKLADETEKREKAEEIASNQKIRAEKAEKLAKGTTEEPNKEVKEESPKPKGELSTKDIYALMENKVAEEDIDEVKDYANLKGISIAEALKTPVVKTILSDKSEQRNTANAANVGGAKRGSGKVSDDAFLSKAKKAICLKQKRKLKDCIRYEKELVNNRWI